MIRKTTIEVKNDGTLLLTQILFGMAKNIVNQISKNLFFIGSDL
jgi:hypothetical protein